MIWIILFDVSPLMKYLIFKLSSNLITYPTHLIKEVEQKLITTFWYKKNILKVISEEVIWKQKAYIISH